MADMTPHSDDELTVVGRTNFHNDNKKFGIKLDDRRRHVYIMGKTGMGKTSLLLNMAVSDLEKGHGLAFVDPHGDVSERLLHYIPEERVDDVIYFNPADLSYPIGFNPLDKVDPSQRHIVTDGLIGVFQKIWADSWGPRLAYILRNCILTLLEYPGTTLLDIMRILVDKNWRTQVVRSIEDPVVKSFWVNEFNNYTEQMMREAISPIQNKVGQFTSSPLIRNIIGQTESTIDLRDIMDNRKILLLNLSKGAIGEGGSQLIGAMMITKMQLAAMSRVDTPEHERTDFFAYIDEFQNFSTDSFAEILSEARKYRLGLILAHQYIYQLSENVQAAVFGNVGTTILFRVGGYDSEVMEKEFGPRLTAQDLVNLPKWKIYVKLMIDGATSPPFSANTIPDPDPPEPDLSETVIATSRRRYGTPKEEVGIPKPDPETHEAGQGTKGSQEAPKDTSKTEEKTNAEASSQTTDDSPHSSPRQDGKERKNRKRKGEQRDKTRQSSPARKAEKTDTEPPASEPPPQHQNLHSSPSSSVDSESPTQSSRQSKTSRDASADTEPETKARPENSDATTPRRTEEARESESAEETESVYNPLLGKKIKELYAKSTTPLGETEYLLKATVQEQLNERAHERLSYEELTHQLLLEIMPDFDWSQVPTEDSGGSPPETEPTEEQYPVESSVTEDEQDIGKEEPGEFVSQEEQTTISQDETPEEPSADIPPSPAKEDLSSSLNQRSSPQSSQAHSKNVIKPGQIVKFRK